MRFPKFQALLAALALAFSAGVFAQPQPEIPELNEAQVAQLEAAENNAALNAAVDALIESGADPRAVASALAARGQTNAQIQAALSAAGVSGQDLGQALASANVTRATVPAPGAPESTPVLAVTGAGLLVGENGEAVYVETEADQALLASAFIAAQLAQDPNYLDDNNNAARGISEVLAAAIAAANPGANADAVAAAVLAALQNADFSNGNASAVLAQALQNAANNVGGGIIIPPVSPS